MPRAAFYLGGEVQGLAERKVRGRAADFDQEITGGASPGVGCGGVGGEIERIEGNLDGLGCPGGEGDALPCGEFAEGLAGGGGEGDVDLGDFVAGW